MLSMQTILSLALFLFVDILVVAAQKWEDDCDVSMLQLHEKPLASCLSFIHIPKTGGYSIELAQLDSAGIKAASEEGGYGETCRSKIRAIRQRDSVPGLKNYSFARKRGIGRFWGYCDDMLRCSQPRRNQCLLSTTAKKMLREQSASGLSRDSGKRCNIWHTPPGLDREAAHSLTKDCDAFAVVREPMDRLMSEFKWETRRDQHRQCNEEVFADFAREKLLAEPEINDCHFIPQVYYVFENGDYKTGKRVSRHVLKTHNLTEEFTALMALYGYNDVQLGEPEHETTQCQVTPTRATEDLVRKYYAADYEAFGF